MPKTCLYRNSLYNITMWVASQKVSFYAAFRRFYVEVQSVQTVWSIYRWLLQENSPARFVNEVHTETTLPVKAVRTQQEAIRFKECAMPHNWFWSFFCPECSKSFRYSDAIIESNNPFASAAKPDMSDDGVNLECPNCRKAPASITCISLSIKPPIKRPSMTRVWGLETARSSRIWSSFGEFVAVCTTWRVV